MPRPGPAGEDEFGAGRELGRSVGLPEPAQLQRELLGTVVGVERHRRDGRHSHAPAVEVAPPGRDADAEKGLHTVAQLFRAVQPGAVDIA